MMLYQGEVELRLNQQNTSKNEHSFQINPNNQSTLINYFKYGSVNSVEFKFVVSYFPLDGFHLLNVKWNKIAYKGQNNTFTHTNTQKICLLPESPECPISLDVYTSLCCFVEWLKCIDNKALSVTHCIKTLILTCKYNVLKGLAAQTAAQYWIC